MINKQSKDTDLITTTAIKTIKIKDETILNLTNALNGTFMACVQHIYTKSSRLVVIGLGKSAIVAQKIVAILKIYRDTIDFHASRVYYII